MILAKLSSLQIVFVLIAIVQLTLNNFLHGNHFAARYKFVQTRSMLKRK